jgi:hypothetical protein
MRLPIEVVFLTAVCCLLAGPAASAEGDDPTWWTSAFLSYSTSLEEDAPSGSIGGFVNGFAMVTPGIGLGAELGHQRLGTQQISWLPEGATEERPLDIGRSFWQLTGNVLARGSVGSFRPYLNGGLGLYLVQTDANDPAYARTDTENRFGFCFGGGTVWSGEGSNWGIGIDARWHDIIKGRLDEGDLDVLTVSAGFMFWGG